MGLKFDCEILKFVYNFTETLRTSSTSKNILLNF